MPAKNRLLRGAVVNGTPKKRLNGALFLLSIGAVPGNKPLFACSVGKKVLPKAHDRNLLKRHCREALRPLLPKIERPAAYVLIARPAAAHATFDEIRRDIEKLLQSCQ
jgi:ribonuclease P protein component